MLLVSGTVAVFVLKLLFISKFPAKKLHFWKINIVTPFCGLLMKRLLCIAVMIQHAVLAQY